MSDPKDKDLWPACKHCGSTETDCWWFDQSDLEDAPCGALRDDEDDYDLEDDFEDEEEND